jgi:hypothetical protein
VTMQAMNPYDVDLSSFETSYVGFDGGFYCFKLELRDQPGFDATMFQMEVSQWLFDKTFGKWHMGNGFHGKDAPKVSLYNPGAVDYFVLLESFPDVVAFERDFKVSGLTPSMLV